VDLAYLAGAFESNLNGLRSAQTNMPMYYSRSSEWTEKMAGIFGGVSKRYQTKTRGTWLEGWWMAVPRRRELMEILQGSGAVRGMTDADYNHFFKEYNRAMEKIKDDLATDGE